MAKRLYKRGATWWARVLGPDGRIRRVTTKCQDEKAARLRLLELERRWANPAHHAARTVTLLDAFRELKVERRNVGRAEGTLSMIEIKARQVMRVLGQDRLIANVTAREVDALIATRTSEGAARATIHKELSTLRGALRLQRRRGNYALDLAEVMPISFALKYVPRVRALSERDVALVLAELPEQRARAICFALATGARWGEVERAEKRDVDGFRVRLRGTKTELAPRTVPVVPFARDWLARAVVGAPLAGRMFPAWCNVRRDLLAVASKLSTCPKCRKARRVVPDPECSTCEQMIAFDPFSPTDLRRTLATLLRAKGVEPNLIAVILGHKDSRMVERVYGRLPLDELETLLDRRLGTKKTQRTGKSRG